MRPINVYINPTYKCNFTCGFCYLGDMIYDSTCLPPDDLYKWLGAISSAYHINGIFIFGGEIQALDDNLVDKYLKIIRLFSRGAIHVITNLYTIKPYLYDPDIHISVSYDYKGRERHKEVYANMMALKKDFSVSMLVTPAVAKLDPIEVVERLNKIDHIKMFELKAYSPNVFNQYKISNLDHEDCVKKYILIKDKMKYDFYNEQPLIDCLNKTYVNFCQDSGIFLTPKSKIAVVDFNKDGLEFFNEFDTLDAYEAWLTIKKETTLKNKFCSSCRHLGVCPSEYMQEVTSMEDSCRGMYNLLEWYEKNIYTT